MEKIRIFEAGEYKVDQKVRRKENMKAKKGEEKRKGKRREEKIREEGNEDDRISINTI